MPRTVIVITDQTFDETSVLDPAPGVAFVVDSADAFFTLQSVAPS
jgi:hypothetical protein